MLIKRVLILWGLLCCSIPIFSQQLSNLRKKNIIITGDTTLIDTLSIVPGSLFIQSAIPLDYRVDFSQSRIIWKKKPNTPDLSIEYRVFPFSNQQFYRRLSFDTVFYRFGGTSKKVSSEKFNNKPIDFGKIATAGSLGRSLSFGNRQDAVLNSSLNLQMTGYLADSIYLSAAISDNNLPIQPDGSTQNLNEIDRVSIQFSKQQWKLQLGDFDIRHQQNYLSFYKRLQGVYFQDKHSINQQLSNDLQVSGAVARGKFTRNIFQGLEGNQGPYRLKGANQEMFFIVLAGTERVFIDGVMMQRGEDQDYIINYNTAEITFMPKQMITKDKRIQVEFEYADRNYLNSQLFLSNTISNHKNFSVTFGYFNNTDAKNSPINQSLGSQEKVFLSGLGDQVNKAFYATAMPEINGNGKILYRKVDTVVRSNAKDTVYVYSQSPSTGLYAVSFYDKGEGNGNYILDTTFQVNGKVYKWIAPDPATGKKYGRYEPDLLLVAPKSQQIYSISSKWDLNPSIQFISDAALSNFDVNTLSQKDKKNDLGAALKLQLTHKNSINRKSGLQLKSAAQLEYADANFRPVERLRTVEFMRDWGLDFIPTAADEKIVSASTGLADETSIFLKYGFTRYERGTEYKGDRHQIDQQFQKNNWIVNNEISLTTFKDNTIQGIFMRPNIDIMKVMPFLSNQSIGLKYSQENSVARDIKYDTITPSSFSFNTFQLSTGSDQNKLNKWAFKYFTRTDELPGGKEMKRVDRSQNYNFQYEWMSNEFHQIRASAIFRSLEYFQRTSTENKEQSLLGRLEYFAKYWKNAINGTALYELGSGQEPKKTFSFFEVPVGQGEYAWIDYNNDNIQQLNEFEIARFRDQAKFYKIFTPTNDFARSNYFQFNYQLSIDPSKALLSSDPFAKLLKRFYFQSNYQVNERIFADYNRKLNPLRKTEMDSTIISSDRISTYALSFNKFSQVWGLDINFNQNAQTAFLSYGPESRAFSDLVYRARVNFKRTWTFDLTSRKIKSSLITPAFSNRNYTISANSIEPRITYTRMTSWRVATSLKIENKTNQNKELASVFSIITEAKYNLVSNAAINLKCNFSNIQYNGTVNSTVAYIMLDGLRTGNNGIWMLDLTKRLSKFIELNIVYEGRKSVGINTIHLGRAQIRALL